MSIYCCECDYFVELSNTFIDEMNTQQCVECKSLIHRHVPHYYVREWYFDEEGNETEKGQHRACEQCGDLALSFLDLGYCWVYGDLRNDIKELNAGGTATANKETDQ